MYIGLDLHKRYSQIAVMTKDGEIVAERRLENDRENLEAFASEYAGSEVAIEATGSLSYVYDILDEEMDVTLVNPSKTRVIAEAKVKTDSIDAKMLAHLLRGGGGSCCRELRSARRYTASTGPRPSTEIACRRTDCREKQSESGAVLYWE